MIRQPTSMRALYAWWQDSLRGLAPPVHDASPECGWYKTKLVKGGSWVAVEIRVEREICPDTGELLGPERLVGVVNGNRADPDQTADIWTYLQPISAAEYRHLMTTIAATPAMHDPYLKIDLTERPTLP